MSTMIELLKSTIAHRFGLITQYEHTRLLRQSLNELKNTYEARFSLHEKERLALVRDVHSYKEKLREYQDQADYRLKVFDGELKKLRARVRDAEAAVQQTTTGDF